MVKVLGMETATGKKPKPLTVSCLKVFNEVFGQIVALRKPVKFQANYYSYGESDLLDHGYFTLSRVVKWLEYCQLVEVERTKELAEGGKGRKTTVWTVETTKLGREVYARGEIITVDVSWVNAIKLGIGRPYTSSFEALWKRVVALAEAGGVSKSRRESWYGNFRDFWMENLTALTKDEAEKKLDVWAAPKIAGAPKMKRRKKLIKSEVQNQFNHQLTVWCK